MPVISVKPPYGQMGDVSNLRRNGECRIANDAGIIVKLPVGDIQQGTQLFVVLRIGHRRNQLKAEPQGNCFQPHVLQRVRRRLASWAKYGYNDNAGLGSPLASAAVSRHIISYPLACARTCPGAGIRDSSRRVPAQRSYRSVENTGQN